MADHAGRYHAIRVADTPLRRMVWAEIAAYLQRYLPPAARVLEIGAGKCLLINALPAAQRWALDEWQGVVECAAPGVTGIAADAGAPWPFPDGSLDVVLNACLFEHLERTGCTAVADEALRVLRPGGVLISILPNFRYNYRSFYDDYTHRTAFTETGFTEFLRSRGFTISRCTPRFLPAPGPSAGAWRGAAAVRPLVWLYLRLPWHWRGELMLVVAQRPADGGA